jgi:hypothetical protein
MNAGRFGRIGVRWLMGLVVAVGLVLPVQAAPTSPVTVTVFVPGGYTGDPADAFSLSDTLAVADLASGISAGDASNIGSTANNFMLSGEFVRFNGNSIEAHVAAGGGDGLSTGLFSEGANRARYEFDGLAITGKVITGIAIYGFDGFGTTGNSGLDGSLDATDFAIFDGLDTVTLFIDEALIFSDRGLGAGENFAEFRIDLLTRDVVGPPDPPGVPEPASVVLALSALLALGWARRRSHRGAAHAP